MKAGIGFYLKSDPTMFSVLQTMIFSDLNQINFKTQFERKETL